VWSAGWLIPTDMERPKYWEETRPSATLSTTDLTWTVLVSKPGLRNEPSEQLKAQVILIFIEGFSPYRAVNTLRLGYTNQSVNAV
jgi:hypothetical protein